MLPAVQRSPRTAPEWLSAHASPSKLDLASQVPPGHGGLAVFIRRIAARARAKSRRWGGPSASVPGSRFPMSCVGKLTRAVLDQVAALVESLAHTSRHRDERLRDQADNQPRARTPAARPLARNELNPGTFGRRRRLRPHQRRIGAREPASGRTVQRPGGQGRDSNRGSNATTRNRTPVDTGSVRAVATRTCWTPTDRRRHLKIGRSTVRPRPWPLPKPQIRAPLACGFMH
jgi:hypothetical protein